MSTPRLELYIDPPSHHFFGDRLFDSSTAATAGDDLMAPWRAVREHFNVAGVPVHTADRLPPPGRDVKRVYVSAGLVTDYREVARRDDVVLSAHFAMECPIVEPRLYTALPEAGRYFRRIMSWGDSESLLPFTRERVPMHPFRWPQSFDGVHEDLWSRRDRRFLVMINSNKLPRLYVNELYTARLRAVEYFHRFGEIDLYGPNWHRGPRRVGKSLVPAGVRYYYARSGLEDNVWRLRQRVAPNRLYAAAAAATKGIAKSKSETLASYRFALCFENMMQPGWITEKIFDCLFAGTIPVYWGAPDVSDCVPPDSFIDMRQFAGFEELRAFLLSIRPVEVERYRNAARDFLESSKFDPFRKRSFVEQFRRFVAEDTGISV